MKSLLKSRRGIAMESAIVFMIITFTLCILLISLIIFGHYQTKIDNIMILDDVEVDQIGEDYLACRRAGQNFEKEYEEYDYTTTDNELIVWHKDNNTLAVLYIKTQTFIVGEGEDATENIHVVEWCYDVPIEIEIVTEASTEASTEAPTE